jgi:MFS family permease
MTSVRRWFTDTTGGLPRTFWHLWTVTLINKLGSFVVIYMTLYLSLVRGYSPATIGILLGIEGAGAVIGTQIAGSLTDRWGRRKTLVLGNFVAAGVLVALAFADSVWAIGALMAAVGGALNMSRPAFSAMIADIVPAPDRVRAYTLNYWAINLGFSGAALLAGLLAGYNYQLIFFVNALAIASTAVLVLVKVPETMPTLARVPDNSKSAEPRGALRVILHDRVFLAFVGLTFLPAFLLSSMEALLPIQVTGSGLTEQQFSWIIATNGIIIVIGQLFIPKLVDGKRRSRVLALACLFWAFGVGAVGLVSTVPLFMLTVVVWTIGEMLQTPANSATIADLAPIHMRGRYQSVFSLAFQGAMLTAPALGGLGMQHMGNWWWAIAFGVGIVAAVGNLVAEPARERRLAQVYAAEATLTHPSTTSDTQPDAALPPVTALDESVELALPHPPESLSEPGDWPRRMDDTGELEAVRAPA